MANTPDQNVTVEMTYHPSGQVVTLTAVNPTTGNQVLRYVYGSAKAWQLKAWKEQAALRKSGNM